MLLAGKRHQRGFSKNGFPVELGRMRVKCGCNWVAIPGREYPLQDVTRVNMAVALHYGLKDLQAQETRDLDLLWERFTYHCKRWWNASRLAMISITRSCRETARKSC